MILILDTSAQYAALGLADGKELIARAHWESWGKGAETLGRELLAMLKKHGARPGEIRGIIVRSGLGSYTGLRVGISFANGFCYANNIPVVGVKLPIRFVPPSSIEELWKRGRAARALEGAFLGPVYPVYALFNR